jgi:predicted amidophosphoribosyltransferase
MAHFNVWRARTAAGLFPNNFPILTAAHYAGTPRRMLVGWKERNSQAADGVLIRALTRVINAAIASDAVLSAANQLTCVTVPTRLRTRVSRGGDPLGTIASHAVRALRGQGVPSTLETGWLKRFGGTDQVGLSAIQRRHNAEGAYRLRRHPQASGTVILIDDIVTTGATLAVCRTLLAHEGVRVAAAVTLCATNIFPLPPLRHTVGTPTG